jgi:hypothetical protein
MGKRILPMLTALWIKSSGMDGWMEMQQNKRKRGLNECPKISKSNSSGGKERIG